MRLPARGMIAALVSLLGCSEPAGAPPLAPATSVPSPTDTAAASASTSPAEPTPSTSSSAVAIPPIPPPEPPLRLRPGGKAAVRGEAGLVTTVEPNATRAGVAILESGGNAIDAAIAAAYVLAVTHPSAGNIGGGGFLVVRLADGRSFALDFREAAPKGATREKLVAEIEAGGVGWPSVAVPGTVAGLEHAREAWGTKPREELLRRAIELAKKGHELSPVAAQRLKAQWPKLKKDPAARGIFGKAKGREPLGAGDRLVQRDLAKTLEGLAREGSAGFYQGAVAKSLAAACAKGGCDVTEDDLAAYRAKIREPLRFAWRGFTVETMPPPSMGGVAVAEILLGLERQKAHESPVDSARSVHLFVECAKRAYADRRSVGADPDFYGQQVPPDAVTRLLSPTYLATRTPPIDPERATPAAAFAAKESSGESPETTHLSVVDGQGNAVALTVTQSASFGAKVVAPGTGVLLSNALGAFSTEGPNAIEPGKHAASSMSPTIVSRDGRAHLIVGSPGGDTIPNTVAQVLRNLVDYGMTVDEAVKQGRVHHQLLPDVLRTESGRDLPEATKKALAAMGHAVKSSPIPLGDAKVILLDPERGEAWGFSDPREGGLALGVKRRPK